VKFKNWLLSWKYLVFNCYNRDTNPHRTLYTKFHNLIQISTITVIPIPISFNLLKPPSSYHLFLTLTTPFPILSNKHYPKPFTSSRLVANTNDTLSITFRRSRHCSSTTVHRKRNNPTERLLCTGYLGHNFAANIVPHVIFCRILVTRSVSYIIVISRGNDCDPRTIIWYQDVVTFGITFFTNNNITSLYSLLRITVIIIHNDSTLWIINETRPTIECDCHTIPRKRYW